MLNFLKKKTVVSSVDSTRDRYESLCAQRDATNARVAPLLADLTEANAAVVEAQARANKIAEQVATLRGGEQWLVLKKEIGMLARALSGIR